MMRIVLIFLLCFIVINLFIGLFHLVRGNHKNGGASDNRVVRSLTIRIVGSILLFAIILIASYFSSPQ